MAVSKRIASLMRCIVCYMYVSYATFSLTLWIPKQSNSILSAMFTDIRTLGPPEKISLALIPCSYILHTGYEICTL